MRAKLTIGLLLIACSAAAQYQPAAVANTYTLTEADGFPGSNYVNSWEIHPSGKVYAKDFFGSLHITGNNFVRFISGLGTITNSTLIKIKPKNELLLLEMPQITILKSDTLWMVTENKNPGLIGAYPDNYSGRLYAIEIHQFKLTFYELKNYDWVAIGTFLLPAEVNTENMQTHFFRNGEFLFSFPLRDGSRKLYSPDTVHQQLNYVGTLSHDDYNYFFPHLYNNRLEKNQELMQSFLNFFAARTGWQSALPSKQFSNHFSIASTDQFLFKYGKRMYEYFVIDSNQILTPTVVFDGEDKINSIRINPAYPYLTMLTGNKPLRVFPYIKKYPRIYDDDNASNIFALVQDDVGRIWAGNYQSQLTIIDPANRKQPLIPLKQQPSPFMNAALNYNGQLYLVGESPGDGILQYDRKGNRYKPKQPAATTGFHLYLTPKGGKVYYPSTLPGYPVFYCDAKELGTSATKWERLDTALGIAPFGMASITEDSVGRIWMGHPKKGFAVYHPATQKGITYHTDKKESPIGFISSVTDARGTVWMGSDDKGLWYYNDYQKPAAPQSLRRINHPLLNDVKRITAMAVYKNWLILGCYDRISLLNLDSFYHNKKIILQYLNPQEASFTGITEQNTLLVSNTDSSVWFSTSDMLYQWDVNTWLQLPRYKVQLAAFLVRDSARAEMLQKKRLRLKAGNYSFDILFEYLSPDALPRFTRTALVQQGDSIIYSKPGMQSRFSYKNLASGAYTFYIDVFEQDGTTTNYEYPFYLNKYIWQQWWFWMLASVLFLLPFVLWINTRRKKALQQKEISQLNVITLSNQFRPHFILNTLNAIGADLKDRPDAESIISRLGESINLIFNYTRQKKVSHYLQDEWTLIENVIQIHRLIYLPDLKVTYHGEDLVEIYKEFEVPLGILEIHVENALLHGLRNKKLPTYELTIGLSADDENLYFTITDNGIGRQQSMAISSYKKHGTGIKNLHHVIEILNQFNKNKIEIAYSDADENRQGTVVTITIPRHYYYEY